jgi:8-oxo-dGTP pyrophosphatase MutT (NUDIX family)
MAPASRTIAQDQSTLHLRDAVAALIVVGGGRYLLQHRDDIRGIWYPDHWGCFGGAVDPGETADEAIARELEEELGWCPAGLVPFTQFDFDLDPLQLGRFFRKYYAAAIEADDIGRIRLGEGRAVRACAADEVLCDLRLAPYDAFALYLHIRQAHLAA